ncbi:holo-acyl-carrier-protein synthase [Alkaliphilus metalliredigens QYMF]|uniref:Holo-[acyl-carrier-protein] synthase n=1 Tax=Alkaliphilus metalliredigens (strain QYMF) TaxID=293826 RepID=ACPS_ALKMQ|nr:holo-ACP synthase [Alkaliphilus metalliredigens]A6TVL0.1 RecName: Full=Holo-[acyl-carrier-protein] synthase; Short=Holo-ACP synthase; AltName: Full=4'-phosphopantetheinyl transferase AcpS [Alkaliphilus metalliredigens QYMF]ABR50228.1 holo-acyl-carrier-protein synthase [Alkaliphilus metalliredigens QYMF]
MIKGIGIDIIEIERIARALEKNPRFKERLFTLEENRGFIEKGGHPASIAGVFAAKEAVVKALGTGISNMKWKDIEVLKDSAGKPYIKLHNNALEIAYSKNINEIFISISHSKENAVAQAIAT